MPSRPPSLSPAIGHAPTGLFNFQAAAGSGRAATTQPDTKWCVQEQDAISRISRTGLDGYLKGANLIVQNLSWIAITAIMRGQI